MRYVSGELRGPWKDMSRQNLLLGPPRHCKESRPIRKPLPPVHSSDPHHDHRIVFQWPLNEGIDITIVSASQAFQSVTPSLGATGDDSGPKEPPSLSETPWSHRQRDAEKAFPSDRPFRPPLLSLGGLGGMTETEARDPLKLGKSIDYDGRSILPTCWEFDGDLYEGQRPLLRALMSADGEE